MDGIPSGSLGPGMQVSGQAPRALLVALEISQVRVGSPAQKKAHLRLEQNGQPGKASLSLIKNVRTGAVPMRALAYHSMVRATSLPVVALCPRVVHHGKLASKGTPLIPTSISPIQWKPGTQMGRPVGGLKKPGLIRLRRLALLEMTAQSPEAARLSGFSNTQLSHNARMGCPASCNRFTKASARLHKKTSISRLLQIARKEQITQPLGSRRGVIGRAQHASQFGQPQAGTATAMHDDRDHRLDLPCAPNDDPARGLNRPARDAQTVRTRCPNRSACSSEACFFIGQVLY